MTPCAACAHAQAHGSWGQAGTHCRKCHLSWTSTAQAHCTVCCGHFASNGTADHHWRKGEHVAPASVEGLHLGRDGIWSTSADRDPDARRQRLAEVRQNARITPPGLAQRPASASGGPQDHPGRSGGILRGLPLERLRALGRPATPEDHAAVFGEPLGDMYARLVAAEGAECPR